MNIAALTNHVFTPSSRYRIRQFIEPLKKHNVIVKDFQRKYSSQIVHSGRTRIRRSPYLLYKAIQQECLNLANTFLRVKRANDFDAMWLSRQLIIGYPSIEFMISKPLIYDIDDAIFLTSSLADKQVKRVTNRADLVFAQNSYIADYLSKYNDSIHIVPTVVDTNLFTPVEEVSKIFQDENDIVTIGWSGTSSSYQYFCLLEDVFIKILLKYKNTKLVFVSDRPPYELKKLYNFVEFIEWAPEIDASTIQNFDIGIMPINNDDWCKGKGAYKMLLYASCGIPVVASSVGENKIILDSASIGIGVLNTDDWYFSLEELIIDSKARSELGANGRKYVVENRNLSSWTKNICRLMIEGL